MTEFRVVRSILVLGVDQDDCLHHVTTSKPILAHRALGAHVALVWHGAFSRLNDSDPFDDLFITDLINGYPDTLRADLWINAARALVKGPAGLTPCERIRLKGAIHG